MSSSRSRGGQQAQEMPLVFPISEERRKRIERMAQNLRPRDGETGDHLDLWLDSYVVRNSETWKIEKKDREKALSPFCRAWRSEMGHQALLRQKVMVENLHGKKHCRRFRAKVTGRLLVGYAQATATEAALGFHRTWGVPRIPATALKGITRAYATLEGLAELELIEQCFGSELGTTPMTPGHVAFYDALPVNGAFELAMDVLTPHHQAYYQGDQPPAEWENPIPCTFLSVVKTDFEFSIGLLPEPNGKMNLDELELATKALKGALTESGVGAKTAAGYGYFVEVRDVS